MDADWLNELVRRDGTRITRMESGNYSIVLNDERVVSACPCCDLPFPKTGYARLVADNFFPIADGT